MAGALRPARRVGAGRGAPAARTARGRSGRGAPVSPRAAGAPPTRLTEEHDTRGFRSGDEVLDSWLRHHALDQHDEGVTTFVLTEGARTVGYYCLTRGAVEHARAATRGWRSRRGPAAPPVPALVV